MRESNAQTPPDDSAVNRFVAQDRRTGAASYLTVPLIGWVSNNDASACSFSTAKYAYTPAPHPDGLPATDPGRPQCGNGVIEFKNGNSWQPVFYAGNDKLDASIAVDATHADVHPQGVTYDELVEKTIAYAAASKTVDPGAQMLGPEFGGWWAYFSSARDVAAGNDADRQAHGNSLSLAPNVSLRRASLVLLVTPLHHNADATLTRRAFVNVHQHDRRTAADRCAPIWTSTSTSCSRRSSAKYARNWRLDAKADRFITGAAQTPASSPKNR